MRAGESKQNRGGRGSTQGPPETQTSKGKTQQSTTGQQDQAATRQEGGAGQAEEDRAEEAAPITLE